MGAVGGADVALCLEYGDEGRFCGGFCGEDGVCPDGYVCEAATSVDGSASSQCRRVDGVCSCDALSRLLSLETHCDVTNDIGTCVGGRFCGPSGLTDCDATEPTDEVCDGEDNNCDGAVDEETCDDGLPCTVDSCDGEAAACSNVPDDTVCDDGVVCTLDACDVEAGGCENVPDEAACDDGDPCTADTCDLTGGCSTAPAEGASCDDGDPCTTGDACTAGTCGGTPDDACCAADSECDDGNPCTQDQCNAATHVCQNDPEPANGTACDDGDGCTLDDACQAGACQSGTPATCGDSADPCSVYGCVATATDSYACEPGPALAGTPCSDNNACTLPDVCDGNGGCLSGVAIEGCCTTGADCVDASSCTIDSCDGSSNTCIHVPQPDGNTCDADGDGCTVDDQCLAGLCMPGPPVDCGAAAPCTSYVCDSQGSNTYSCLTLHATTETACDDAQSCTGGDSCNGTGQCVGNALDCAAQAGSCRVGLCDEGAGGCVFTNLDNGTDCDADANGCTVGDSCTSGFCLPGTAADCSSYDDVCITGICQSLGASGFACGTVPQSTGSPCENGDYCTVDDVCDGDGACVAGAPRDCQTELGDQCNSGSCDQTAKTCVKNKVTNGTACDDGQACTLSSQCANGICLGGDDICVDQRLDVEGYGFNPPTVASLGYGRYVVQWTGTGSNRLRRTDAHGSREGEEVILEGGSSQTWAATMAVDPSGHYTVLQHFLGEETCGCKTGQSAPCGNTQCDRSSPLQATTFLGGQQMGWSGTVVDLNYKSNSGWCNQQPKLSDNRVFANTVSFADQGKGVVMSWGPTLIDPGVWLCGFEIQSPAFDSIVYLPLTQGLEAGAAVELVSANDTTDIPAFDTTVVPDGSDRLLLVWAAADGEAVHLRAYDQLGVGETASPVTLVTGVVGETVHGVRVVGFADSLFVVVWDVSGADGDGRGIFAQRYYPDGTPVGNTIQLTGTTQGDQRLGGMDVFSDGSYVVVYDDEYGDTVGWGVKARRVSSDDTLQPEVLVNSNEAENEIRPDVAVLSGDQWVVVFENDLGFVFTRRYYKDGSPAPGVPERRANLTTAGSQSAPAAAQSDEGTVLVVYASPVPGYEDGEILARAFEADGVTGGDETLVNATTTKAQTNPAVAGGPDRFVVVWQSLGEDGSLDGVFARLLDGAGQPLASPFPVNVTTASYQRDPSVAMLPNGDFAVAWSGYVATNNFKTDVILRIFDKDAGELAGEVLVHDTQEGTQVAPSVAGAPSLEQFAVAYVSSGVVGAPSGIYVRKISASGTYVSDPVHVSGASVDPEQPTVAISPDGASLAVCWKGTGSPDELGTSWTWCTILDYETLAVTVPGFVVSNEAMAGVHERPSLAYLDSGDLVVAWDATNVDGWLRSVQYATVASGNGAADTRVVANRTWEGDQHQPFVVPLSDSGFWVGWETDGQDEDGAGVTYRVLPPQ
jgi:hypothetical protein